MSLHITEHAKARGRERLSWSAAALARQAPRILAEGVPISAISGSLRRFLDKQVITHRKGNNVRIWSRQVFVFQDETLITVYALPAECRATADKLAAKKGGA